MTLETIWARVFARLCQFSLNQPKSYRLETKPFPLAHYSVGQLTVLAWARLTDVSGLSCVCSCGQLVAGWCAIASLLCLMVDWGSSVDAAKYPSPSSRKVQASSLGGSTFQITASKSQPWCSSICLTLLASYLLPSHWPEQVTQLIRVRGTSTSL